MGDRVRLSDIKQFPRAYYRIDVSWSFLRRHIYPKDQRIEINLEPDYQRGHVWSEEQRVAFVEYGLRGGEAARTIVTNCPGWMGDFRGPYELVDGLQRITSVLMFLDNRLKAFGHYLKEYEDRERMNTASEPSFGWHVLNLPTRREVLDLYIRLNSGGTVHSQKEITRVKKLLDGET